MKFSYREAREYETIESDIAELEVKIAELESEMNRNGADFVKLAELDREKSRTEELLMEKMERWESLADLAQRIEQGELVED